MKMKRKAEKKRLKQLKALKREIEIIDDKEVESASESESQQSYKQAQKVSPRWGTSSPREQNLISVKTKAGNTNTGSSMLWPDFN